MHPYEGYIKFNCFLEKSSFEFADDQFESINKWRQKLYNLGLIGTYPDGIGFGNISIRTRNDNFIITGSATGGKPVLTKNDYVLVTFFDLSKNEVRCTGSINASSESMTHAALYHKDMRIGAVIHVHNLEMWEKLKKKLPVTSGDVPYGTPEMAFEVSGLFDRTSVTETKIFVMGGHKEGIVSFGKDLDEAGNILLDWYSGLNDS